MGGYIHSLLEIFDILPKTVLAHDLDTHHVTFKKHMENPATFTLEQLYQIAALIDVDNWEILKLAHKEAALPKKKKKAKRKK